MLAGLTDKNSGHSLQSSMLCPDTNVPHRVTDCHRKTGALRSLTHETHTLASQKQLEGPRDNGKDHSHPKVTPPTSKMVAGGKQCYHRSTVTPTKTCSANLYRCIKRRMGRSYCKGNLVPPRKQVAYKPFGAKGGFSDTKRVPRPLLQQHSSGSHRQHNSGCLCQQGRGDEVGLPVCPTVENPVLVYQKTGNSQSTSHSQPAEHDSRQAVQTWPDHSNGVVPSSGSVPSYMLPVAPASSGPVCHHIQQQTTTVCLTGPRPPGMGSGCTQSVLGGSGPICLPTGGHLGQSSGEVTGLPMQQNHTDCTGVAQHALWFWDLVAMSSQIPLCLPNLPNLVSQPFNQTLHRNLSYLNLHAWLLEPQQSRSRDSLRQWQHELRLLKEDQPDPSMRQSGPFLQSGASVIRWTSGHHL